MYTISVSSLNEQIKSLLETSFTRVLVEGELSRITFHNSGHIYFTLKDASSSIKAVMFRGNASKIRFELKEGMKVVLDGAISLYKPRGEYQINCFSIDPSGQGALALAYEQLKEKLSLKGYFEASIKKELPNFPSRIALITSATGAALQDMIRVANTRYKAVEIDVYDVLVQGQSAAWQISNAINAADKNQYDILVVGRGGGSIEDLWAFNEEIVADAIFKAITPVISAVGHEIDWVISDFVSDLRVATPSVAMQVCLPDTNELYQYLDSLGSQFDSAVSQKLCNRSKDLDHLKELFSQNSIQKQLQQKTLQVQQCKEQFFQTISFKIQNFSREKESLASRFPHLIDSILNNKQNQLDNFNKMLESNNPKLKSKSGFAQISKNKKVIDISELDVNDDFELQSDTIYLSARVIKKENI